MTIGPERKQHNLEKSRNIETDEYYEINVV